MATAPTPVEEKVENKPTQPEELPLVPVIQDKPIAPPPHDVDDTKALPKVEAAKSSKETFDRDVALSKLEDEKRVSFLKAWEDNEKSKVENKAQNKLSEVSSWENSKKADIESKLKKIEEQLEKKKAEYAEKMKNKVALVHKQAEEKRAMVEAIRGEELLKTDEISAKYRATGQTPKQGCGCLG